MGWGLGFRFTRERYVTYVGHSGKVPGYRTQLLICPTTRIAVIVLSNAEDCDPLACAERAFRWVAPALVTRAAPKPEPEAPDPGWQRYAGRYRDAWGDSQVLVYQGKLVIIDPASPDPLQGLGTLTPVAEHTFLHETDDGYSAPGELAVFELGDDNKVERLKLGENYRYRVATWVSCARSA